MKITDQRQLANGRDMRTLWRDDVTLGYHLASRTDGTPLWLLVLNRPLPEEPDRVSTGTYQELEAGHVFVVPRDADGPTEVVFLGGSIAGEYRIVELPD